MWCRSLFQNKYKSNLLEAFVEKTEQLSKNSVKPKNKTPNNSSSVAKTTEDKKINSNENMRKRGRPPKSKISSMAEIEAYMRLDCTVSNVSPDSGIQSNAGSPLYHGLQSPASYNAASRLGAPNHKPGAATSNLKALSLSQKAVLCASKKNSQKNNSIERKNSPSGLQVYIVPRGIVLGSSKNFGLLKVLGIRIFQKKTSLHFLKNISKTIVHSFFNFSQICANLYFKKSFKF